MMHVLNFDSNVAMFFDFVILWVKINHSWLIIIEIRPFSSNKMEKERTTAIRKFSEVKDSRGCTRSQRNRAERARKGRGSRCCKTSGTNTPR